MSFLRRLFGGSSQQGAVFNVNYFARTRDDAALEVVGEAYRQELVVRARPPGPDDMPPGLPPPPTGYYKALLFRQPDNKYDANAIVVTLWAGRDWSMAGYLSRTDAAAYQPLFHRLAATSATSPPAIACDAALKQERGGIGVVLHLGTPGECAIELATDGVHPSAHAWLGKQVAFTGQGGTTVYGVPLDRPAQVMLARWAGCDVLPRLTKACHALIASDPNELTANLQKAKDYGIPVVQEPEFLSAVGVPVEAIARRSGRWAGQ
jgi:hypothetical protein